MAVFIKKIVEFKGKIEDGTADPTELISVPAAQLVEYPFWKSAWAGIFSH